MAIKGLITMEEAEEAIVPTIAGVSELMRDYTFSSSKFKSLDTS